MENLFGISGGFGLIDSLDTRKPSNSIFSSANNLEKFAPPLINVNNLKDLCSVQLEIGKPLVGHNFPQQTPDSSMVHSLQITRTSLKEEPCNAQQRPNVGSDVSHPKIPNLPSCIEITKSKVMPIEEHSTDGKGTRQRSNVDQPDFSASVARNLPSCITITKGKVMPKEEHSTDLKEASQTTNGDQPDFSASAVKTKSVGLLPPQTKPTIQRKTESIVDLTKDSKTPCRPSKRPLPDSCQTCYHGSWPEGSGPEMALPVFDLSQPGVLQKMASLGISSVIPLSKILCRSGNGIFAIPVVPVAASSNPSNCDITRLGANNLLPIGMLKNLYGMTQ